MTELKEAIRKILDVSEEYGLEVEALHTFILYYKKWDDVERAYTEAMLVIVSSKLC